MDAGRYYADLDAERFQIPQLEGLAESFDEDLAKPVPEEATSLVAELEGRVVGWIYARLEAPAENAAYQLLTELGQTRLVIDALVVEEPHRRRGVGTEMMHAVEAWAKARGATIASVDTYIDSPISVPFYVHRMRYARKSLSLRKPLT